MPLLLAFAFTLFVSATLLFLVQPMIGKTLLPMLGGTPAVWNTCMVFFQALLLAGYAYAHATTALLGVRRQALVHLGVLALPFLSFGLTVNRGLLDYGEGSPIPGLLLVLLMSVGLPFFVVSTSAPLLQKWFAGTGHPQADDPYFLYGASNLGSMLALIGYPALVEPHLKLAEQRLYWQIGYGVLAGLTALCAVCLWRSGTGGRRQGSGVRSQESGVRGQESEVRGQGSGVSKTSDPSFLTLDSCLLTPGRRLRWVLLSFVPSSLMLGATTYLTTDIAPIPLIWVFPLGLYLLSFILVFSRLPGWVHRFVVGAYPYLMLPLVFLMLSEYSLNIAWKIALHLAVLFMTAMVCHGELARDRPPTKYLTEFYLWMSFGGILGGLFIALAAPIVFDSIVEYPLVLVVACLLTPVLDNEPPAKGILWDAVLMGFYLGAGAALLVPALGRSDLDFRGLRVDGPWLLLALVGAVALIYFTRPADRDGRTARWLDLGLPLGLAVLAVGLNLGLRMSTVHEGLELAVEQSVQAVSAWSAKTFGEGYALPERVVRFLDPRTGGPLVIFLFVFPVALCALFIGRPLRFGLGVGALFLASSFCDLLNEDILIRQRSFFGAFRVNDDGPFRRLEHGTTLHGQQRTRWTRSSIVPFVPALLAATDPLGGAAMWAAFHDAVDHPGREPLTYFHRSGPIGQVFAAYEPCLAGRHVGLIGLGCGTLAAYGHAGQRMTFYEIDPLVKRISYDDRKYFTYVQDAVDRGVKMDLVLGDARLKLEERAQNGAEPLALLVCDAFSSDAIPVHLITSEAIKIFLANLAEDGLLAFHISNRYLNLEPVLANLAEVHGLFPVVQSDGESARFPGKAGSHWVFLARRQSDLEPLLSDERWQHWKKQRGWNATEAGFLTLLAVPDLTGNVGSTAALCWELLERLGRPWRGLQERPEVGVWTDDYSNLLSVFEAQK